MRLARESWIESIRDEELTANGRPVLTDSDHLGPLVDSSPLLEEPAALAATFDSEGYVFLRGLVDSTKVMAARRELLLKYAVVGEIDDRRTIDDAEPGDRAGLASANLRALSASLRSGACYEAVIHDRRMLEMVGGLLGGAAEPFTFRWPRLVRPGEGCGFHCDGPYMSRATDRHLSCWIPLGRVEPRDSALMLLEGSHVDPALSEGYLTMDADLDGLTWLDDDPTVVQETHGRRWLTTVYEPGDVLVFSMRMLHGAFDNTTQRCRLSTDSRYYLHGETPDPRWNGLDLEPHGPGRVFYPGLGRWANADFQDEWKFVDERGRLEFGDERT